MGKITAIFMACEAGAPLHSVPEATLESGRGLVGDRYYEHSGTFSEKLKDGVDWEITLIESEEIRRFNEEQGLALAEGSFRRNIIASGVKLNDLVGHRFCVGTALLEGIRLCEPCAYLGTLLGPEVVRAMAHRAGLRARIVSGAVVRPGDQIAVSRAL